MQTTDGGRPSRRATAWGPALLLLGAGILLYRTVALLVGGAASVLRRWVVGLTLVEMCVDAVTMLGAARWWRSRAPRHARLPLRAGAVATVLHAVRVAVFVLGRTGPWVDFDVRPDQREGHDERWSWSQVVFAGVMAVLGVLGLAAIWRVRRRTAAGGRAGRSDFAPPGRPARHYE